MQQHAHSEVNSSNAAHLVVKPHGELPDVQVGQLNTVLEGCSGVDHTHTLFFFFKLSIVMQGCFRPGAPAYALLTPQVVVVTKLVLIPILPPALP